MDRSIRASFANVKKELDVHLDTINENTNEINSNYQHIIEVEAKIDKLNERIDEIQLFLNQIFDMGTKNESYENIKLNNREKEVFLSIYTCEDHTTYAQVARLCGLTEQLVKRAILSMIYKGVPIVKRIVGGEVFFALDEEFKHLQAKKNFLNINEMNTQSLLH